MDYKQGLWKSIHTHRRMATRIKSQSASYFRQNSTFFYKNEREKKVVKPIPNFEDYKATKTGNIIGKYGIVLKSTTKQLYKHVSLYKNRKKHIKYIHQLVLETFVGPCPKKMECNHKDGNKHNNNLSNLEWVTASKNNKHAFKIGLKDTKGEKHPNSKLKTGEVWLIKKILKTNIVKQTYIAKIFNLNKQHVTNIKKERIWKHI